MKNNFIVNAIITKQIACAYVLYRNDRLANECDDIISFEQYAELFALNLKCNLNEINEVCESVNIKIDEEKKQAKIEKKNKKRGAK